MAKNRQSEEQGITRREMVASGGLVVGGAALIAGLGERPAQAAT